MRWPEMSTAKVAPFAVRTALPKAPQANFGKTEQ
jgi:hypothetical protein